jgi:hypothetical protein
LGVLLAALSISGFVDETGRVPLYIPLIALGVPLLDTGLAFTRRLLNGRHPLHPDEDHVHHRMPRVLGMRPRPLALALYGYARCSPHGPGVARAARHPCAVRCTGHAALVATFIVRLGYHDTLWQSRAPHASWTAPQVAFALTRPSPGNGRVSTTRFQRDFPTDVERLSREARGASLPLGEGSGVSCRSPPHLSRGLARAAASRKGPQSPQPSRRRGRGSRADSCDSSATRRVPGEDHRFGSVPSWRRSVRHRRFVR